MFKRSALMLLAFIILLANVVAQTSGIPAKPNPPRLVNDFANFLSPNEQNYLERKLVLINDSSSVQIVVLVLKTLENDINALGPDIIKEWGIGQAGKDNGILLIIKPKAGNEKGQIAISTGYGMEAIITDAISKQIIDRVIVPAFKNGQYYQGIDEAVNTIYALSKGEFPANLSKNNKRGKSKFPLGAMIVVALIAIAIFGNRSGGSQHLSSGGGLAAWLLMSTMMSGRGGGGFGSFSEGGGSFGGFGGGSGGGGGASGSW